MHKTKHNENGWHPSEPQIGQKILTLSMRNGERREQRMLWCNTDEHKNLDMRKSHYISLQTSFVLQQNKKGRTRRILSPIGKWRTSAHARIENMCLGVMLKCLRY